MDVGTMEEPDVADYPGSGKFAVAVGAAPGGDKAKRVLTHLGKKADAVDYWIDEDRSPSSAAQRKRGRWWERAESVRGFHPKAVSGSRLASDGIQVDVGSVGRVYGQGR